MDRIDILKRTEFVNQLLTIIEKISNSKKSTSFAIDGAWGTGKSFVLDMFEENINETSPEGTLAEKYFLIRYNCWQYDYYEEPLVAIVATMLDAIENKTEILSSENREKIKGVLKAVGATFLSFSNGVLKNNTGIDLGEAYKIVKSGIVSGEESYKRANEYDKYFSFKKALNSLQNILKELSENYTVVFLVDELDRCLPEYAIKVLERLHHIIEGTKNIIHIISIDKGQLQTSVNHTFGFDNPEEYLKKFIQFTVSLNLGTISEKITDKYSDYLDLFEKELIRYDDSIEEFMKAVFQKIGAREQESLMHRITIAHKMLFSEVKDYGFMCMELLIAVAMTYYKSTRYLCESLKPFNGVVESGKEPPFNTFFDQKFKSTSQYQRRIPGSSEGKQLVFNANNSLYAAIFAMWYELFLNNKNARGFIMVDDLTLHAKLMKNTEELKEFSNIIRLIK